MGALKFLHLKQASEQTNRKKMKSPHQCLSGGIKMTQSGVKNDDS